MVMNELKNRTGKLPYMQSIKDRKLSENELERLYDSIFGDVGLIWDIPSLGTIAALGLLIVPVREGMMAIPYYSKTYKNGIEDLDYQSAYILDYSDIVWLCGDLNDFANSFDSEMYNGYPILAKTYSTRESIVEFIRDTGGHSNQIRCISVTAFIQGDIAVILAEDGPFGLKVDKKGYLELETVIEGDRTPYLLSVNEPGDVITEACREYLKNSKHYGAVEMAITRYYPELAEVQQIA